MKYKLISMFSEPDGGDYYTRAATRLAAQCVGLGIPHRIERRENAGDWLKNTKLKGPFVHDILEDEKAPVLWVDVDCPVSRVPELDEFSDVDFAAVEFMAKSNLNPPLKIMGTSLFFNYTEGGRRLAKEWKELCEDKSRWEAGDHRLLSNLLYDNDWLNWRFLPDCYCRNRHNMRGDEEAVISLGLAKEVTQRREIMNGLHKQGLA